MKLVPRAAIAGTTALFILVPVLLVRGRAEAHQEQSLGALTVLNRITPTMPEVEIVVTHPSVPIITIRNRSDRAVVIEGLEGEPFLRIGDSVELNASSPTAYQSLDPSGTRALPPGLSADKDPQWIKVSRSSVWSWLDPRLAFAPGMSLDTTWQIPGRWGTERVSIEGGFEPLDAHGHFATQIDVSDHPEGLDIQFLFGNVPGIYVKNNTKKVLEVPGLQDEPFLRIGPRGTFANMLSPTYHFAGAQRLGRIPANTDPTATPRWERVSTKPIWAWLELRARLSAEAQLRSVLGDERRTVLSWTSPMYLGDQTIELRGDLDWIPPTQPTAAADGEGGINPVWALVGAAWLGVGGLAVQRHRTRRRQEKRPSEARRARNQKQKAKSRKTGARKSRAPAARS